MSVMRSYGIPFTFVAGAWLNSAAGLLRYTFCRYIFYSFMGFSSSGTSPDKCNSSWSTSIRNCFQT